jgi:allophanate hydrolase subunit 1
MPRPASGRLRRVAGSAVIERRAATAGRPAVTFRRAGDRALLAEFGEETFDLTLNFLVQALDEALRERPLPGLVEAAPGFRAVLVSYDPFELATARLIAHLDEVVDGLWVGEGLVLPSRLVRLPIAFDDSQTRAAVSRYAHSIRADAPNAEGGTNVPYMVRYNGLADAEELYASVLGTEHWVGFIGFFPGLPFMFPLDPRHAVVAPKYNPTRTWTPEGAVGLGGPCWSIYPVESAGGYQLVGRTLPVYDLAARNAAFRESPLLLRPGDRVQFERVSEEELLALREAVAADHYRYRIEPGELDVAAFLRWREEIAAEADERQRAREAAAAETPVP